VPKVYLVNVNWGKNAALGPSPMFALAPPLLLGGAEYLAALSSADGSPAGTSVRNG